MYYEKQINLGTILVSKSTKLMLSFIGKIIINYKKNNSNSIMYFSLFFVINGSFPLHIRELLRKSKKYQLYIITYQLCA